MGDYSRRNYIQLRVSLALSVPIAASFSCTCGTIQPFINMLNRTIEIQKTGDAMLDGTHGLPLVGSLLVLHFLSLVNLPPSDVHINMELTSAWELKGTCDFDSS